jgi:hypothetical protein
MTVIYIVFNYIILAVDAFMCMPSSSAAFPIKNGGFPPLPMSSYSSSLNHGASSLFKKRSRISTFLFIDYDGRDADVKIREVEGGDIAAAAAAGKEVASRMLDGSATGGDTPGTIASSTTSYKPEVVLLFIPLVFLFICLNLGLYGGMGMEKAASFSDWGGLAAMYAAWATYIGAWMTYGMVEKNRDLVLKNRKEDKEDAVVLREKDQKREDDIRLKDQKREDDIRLKDQKREDGIRVQAKEEAARVRKIERLERKEEKLEDVIAELHSKHLSAWLPSKRHAIDQEIKTANKKLEELQLKVLDLEF